MTETAKLGLPLIAAAQAQKHVTHNEALTALDTLVQLAALDKDLSSPPAEPEEGDAYIVADGASGAWEGFEDRIARFQDGDWVSFVPGPGWLAWVIDEERLYRFDGDDWALAAVGDVLGPASTTENHVPQWDEAARTLKNGRPIGVGSGSAIPDRTAADTRYARLAANNAFTGTLSWAATAQDSDANDLFGANRIRRLAGSSANAPTAASAWVLLNMWRDLGNRNAQLALLAAASSVTMMFRGHDGDAGSPWREVWHTGNTTVDDGFIKEASPIVRVEAGRIERHMQSEGAQYERLGVGHYRVTGTLGLAKKGWRLGTPQDENGNRLVYAELDEADGEIILRTYEPAADGPRIVAGAPMDIPDGRYVSLRLEALPEPEIVEEDEETGETLFAPPPVTPAHVDHEMWRRIAALLGVPGRREAMDELAFGHMEATRLINRQARQGQALTASEEARAARLEEVDGAVMALRERAAALKAREPIPEDYADDRHWE